jgi:SAM-dependent methyltransferase
MSGLSDWFKRARGDALVRRSSSDIRAEIRDLSRLVREQTAAIERLTRDSPTASGESPAPARRAPISARTDQTTWQERAQEGELAFHKRPNVRSSTGWDDDTHRKWTTFGFERDGWNEKLIVDVGAGSRLRTRWFTGARVAAIEPLGEQFINEVEWQDLAGADELYPVPAEQHIPELVGRADLIVSINALDHGYDFEGAVRNIRSYVKDDGLVFLSFDQHETPDEMHPLVLDEPITREILERHGFVVDRFLEAGRYHGGHGLEALNYWLRPQPTA